MDAQIGYRDEQYNHAILLSFETICGEIRSILFRSVAVVIEEIRTTSFGNFKNFSGIDSESSQYVIHPKLMNHQTSTYKQETQDYNDNSCRSYVEWNDVLFALVPAAFPCLTETKRVILV